MKDMYPLKYNGIVALTATVKLNPQQMPTSTEGAGLLIGPRDRWASVLSTKLGDEIWTGDALLEASCCRRAFSCFTYDFLCAACTTQCRHSGYTHMRSGELAKQFCYTVVHKIP